METTLIKKEVKQPINKKFTIENILCAFIIMCPILDIISFIFRNNFKTEVSISTFIRPIIPLAVGLYIFIKGTKREKMFLGVTALIYIGYGIVHLIIAKSLLTGCSYGTIKNENQYIFNFTFLIIDLIIYFCTFTYKNKDDSNIKKALIIMTSIYIASIYLAILTKTSSYTYAETQTGYKGWIESGNSLSAILLLSLFCIISQFKFSSKNDTKKQVVWEIYTLVTITLTIIYLGLLIGTRTGLFGIFIAIASYIVLEVIFSKNKKLIAIGTIFFIIIILIIGEFGSNTIKRRKQMNEAKSTIIDEATNEVGNMTGDMLRIKNKILDNTLEEGFMSEAQSKSVLDLYEYAKKHNIAGNDTRQQQLIYNIYLVKNQKNILAILFGNGYKTNFREMVMENELASMLLNFGIIGFILYIGPFLAILIFALIEAIRNIRKIDVEYVMLTLGLAMSLVLSFLSGYVFFATSSMIVIVATSVMLVNKAKHIKDTKTNK